MSMDQLNKIKEILENHVGKENQISSGDIGPQIGIQEDATHVQVRNLIREAIEKLRIPIGGSSRGYYLIKDEAELKQYTDSIDKRMEKMKKRKEIIEQAFDEYY
ncbi:hypothetical protein [Desulfosarcina ovata]|uniref:Helix-turn-helix type 11 domain-containing protein n=1 Tax=Desulfosarcina ovata subsp. ovata TaxID=2752305 RepID=A0A5K8A378_9BACT|nr:hypothetical protein [Desulfosarcina ovata]BBO87013.1 hypothetical protein DSCOOX_01930 [Desulfosarcina ovata subsp. ovata]